MAVLHIGVTNKSIAWPDFLEPTCLAGVHCGDYIQTPLWLWHWISCTPAPQPLTESMLLRGDNELTMTYLPLLPYVTPTYYFWYHTSCTEEGASLHVLEGWWNKTLFYSMNVLFAQAVRAKPEYESDSNLIHQTKCLVSVIRMLRERWKHYKEAARWQFLPWY